MQNVADGSFTLKVQAWVCLLIPSLRRAMQLQSGYKSSQGTGLQALARDVSDGSLAAAVAILQPDTPERELAILANLEALKTTLLFFIAACSGVETSARANSDTAAKPTKPGKPQSIGDYHRDLYKAATGWMHWTPEEALNATPAQITLAFEGHMEMLRAIHGAAEKQEPANDGPWDRNVRSIFAGRGTVKVDASELEAA